jgi:xanthine/CO dehydrogenase XdhC/CoxF family maturation factor
MKEINDIIKAYDDAVIQNKQTALVTVVKVVGSSYRRPGARMIVTEDGQITGAISGGCLEGDALRKALLAMSQRKNKLIVYDTTDEEDAKLGVQLGCNGIVSILFEPINNDDEVNPINLLKTIVAQRRNTVLVTIFNEDKNAAQVGSCYLVDEDENIVQNGHWKELAHESKTVLTEKESVIKNFMNQSALFQFVSPAVQLIIAGAGNDAQPLVEMASILGWRIIVADGRATHATTRRFPKATGVIVCKPQDLLSHVEADGQTAFILMTHNYNYDLELLGQLANVPCAYIGILGPKKKLQRIFDELNGKGIQFNKEQLQIIHGPVGLDIGAETSEEIALAVLSEIKAVFSKRNASSLKFKTSAIHHNYSVIE